ncbi:hypothetical protein [Deinococcus sp. QL22]|uniref:hypothetical protein n=1 Tax=Deinococcus sp. QL22 TaxID=2939437 RepID=UPI00201834B2|nr:hypothetical protein [Deinococcus sp. QL22]UQN06285.1 hypothetical protein M1R55_15720 [Deinococcus sp. QL22]
MWRRDQPTEGRTPHWSGFTLRASDAKFSDPTQQMDDAMDFLKRYERELAVLATFPGVDTRDLDFGIEDRDVGIQGDVFPSELLLLMGRLNINLGISRFPRLLKDDAEQLRASER